MNYKKELQENILHFWLTHAQDETYGGIFTCLDETGEIYGREKSVWFQGRALWVFAKAYNVIEKNPAYLAAANNIYRFLPYCGDETGRMFFTVTEDGREIQKRRYYFSETFAAIGCAELYKATGEKAVWEKAEQYFKTAYRLFKGIDSVTPKFNPQNAPYKALSPVMIMLSTAQCMRSVDYDKYDQIVKEMLQEILHGGYLTEDALLENISFDGKFVDTPTGRTINPGHSLEAAWFLMSEGLQKGDKTILDAAYRITDFSMKCGLQNGGIKAFADVKGKPPVALEWDMQLWWPQCEAMIANKLAYRLTGNIQYRDAFDALYEYTDMHFADRKHGEWYGYLHYDGTVANTLKGNLFKGPFHIPRLYIWLTLEAEGKIDLF